LPSGGGLTQAPNHRRAGRPQADFAAAVPPRRIVATRARGHARCWCCQRRRGRIRSGRGGQPANRGGRPFGGPGGAGGSELSLYGTWCRSV